jgi:hypothetical protein
VEEISFLQQVSRSFMLKRGSRTNQRVAAIAATLEGAAVTAVKDALNVKCMKLFVPSAV